MGGGLSVRARRITVTALVVYAIAAALIAFWPVPVDRGATGALRSLEHLLPWATYRRVEFTANIVYFIPLGALLAVLLARSRYLVLPIGILCTLTIEVVQGELLTQRAASLTDVIANTAGTCVGLLLVAVVERMRARAPHAHD